MTDILKSYLGSTVILESDTGSGKSETAVAHFIELLCRGLVDGCYFALPTRTSAAQIHKRIKRAIDKLFAEGTVPVTLAVPGYLTGETTPEAFIKAGRPFPSGRNWYEEHSKRYLASRIAVGTIDQPLMSVLHAKHSTLRWSSFARSLLIVDEVHASDAYMAEILEEVIRQHVARGGHVLLMSATLGSAAAHRFLAAAGAIPTMPNLHEACALPYPCVRHVVDGLLTTTALPTVGYERSVRIETTALMDDARAVAELAASHVRQGAKVLVIRNMVSSCVAVHRELEKLLPPENILRSGNGTTVPHHGRFAASDRAEIDAAIEKAFGKTSVGAPVVAVGTQTIEQSLDIDADIIVTDLCPIDVLLQRLGRLHRHRRPRPTGYDQPVAVVLKPSHDVSAFAAKPGHGIGKDRAYEHVVPVVLTLRQIERRGLLRIPQDNREIVEQCTHPDAVEGFLADHPALRRHDESSVGADCGRRTTAAIVRRNPNWRYGDKVTDFPTGGVASRLGDPGTRVSFADEPTSALGLKVAAITIPHFLCRSSQGLVDVEKGFVLKRPHGFEFHVGDEAYSYGPHGLEKIDARLKPANNESHSGSP